MKMKRKMISFFIFPSTGALVERNWGKTEVLGGKACPDVTLSATNPTWTDPGIEPGPPRWEAGDYLPEPWHGRNFYVSLCWTAGALAIESFLQSLECARTLSKRELQEIILRILIVCTSVLPNRVLPPLAWHVDCFQLPVSSGAFIIICTYTHTSLLYLICREWRFEDDRNGFMNSLIPMLRFLLVQRLHWRRL
jgi:hypothetical protein